MKISAREKGKPCNQRFCYQIYVERETDEESEHPEKERQNEMEINTYLQQRVFLSLHRDLVWNINGDSAEMSM